MPVFFSGTDLAELDDNSEFQNYYLSLIVNNFMDFEAKVAFRGEVSVDEVAYTCKNEDGEEYKLVNGSMSRTKLFMLDCKIESPDHSITVPEEFSTQVESIIKTADQEERDAQKKAMLKDTYKGAGSPGGIGGKPRDIDQGFGFDRSGWYNGYSNDRRGIAELLDAQEACDRAYESLDVEENFTAEQFLAFCLRLGNPVPDGVVYPDGEEELEDAIETLKLGGVDLEQLTTTILENLTKYYAQFYDIKGDWSYFSQSVDECIDLLDNNCIIWPKLGYIKQQFAYYANNLTKENQEEAAV